MKEFFRKNSMFLCLAIVVSFAVNGLYSEGLFAKTDTVDPAVTSNGQADVPNPPLGETGKLSRAVSVSWDDGADLAAGSAISINAPSGLKFTNITGVKVTFTNGVFESPTGTNIASGGNLTSEFLTNDDTEIKINVTSLTAGANAGSINIGSTTLSEQICICPEDDTIKAMTENNDLKLSVTTNGGNSNSETSTFSGISLLNRPDIVTAVEDSSTSIILTLKAGVDEGTGTGEVNPDGSQFKVFDDKGDSGAVTVTAAEVDDDDPKKVTLTTSTSVDFDQNPNVHYNAVDLVENEDDRSGVTAAVDNIVKMVVISKENTETPTVTVDSDMAGTNHEAFDENVNKVTAKITSTAGQPLKLMIVASDDADMASPLDLDHVSVVISGKSGELLNEHGENTVGGAKGDGVTAEDALLLNRDILCIDGEDNGGEIDVIVKFGLAGTSSFSSVGDLDGIRPLADAGMVIGDGDVEGIKIMVSADGFVSKTGFDELTIDRKSPSLITSGDNKPKQIDRETVKLTFDEPLDPDEVEDESNWRIGGIDADSVSLDSETRTMVTIKTESLLEPNDTLNIQVQAGDPTEVPGDAKFNPIERGTGFVTIGTVDTDAENKPTKSAASIEPTVEGNTAVSETNSKIDIKLDANQTGIDSDLFVLAVYKADADKPLGIDFNSPINDPFQGGDIGLVEKLSPSGRYEGELTLTASRLEDGDEVKLLCAFLDATTDDLPGSVSDWEDLDAIMSDPIAVDNSEPTLEAAMFGPQPNEVTAWYSEGMNLVVLRDQLPVVLEDGIQIPANSVRTESSGQSQHVIYTLVSDLDPNASSTKLFHDEDADDNMPTDLAGNEMKDDDKDGVDEIDVNDEGFTTPTPTGTESPTPTPTGTESPTPTPTGTESPTPTPTGTESPTPTPTGTESPTPTPTGTESPTPTPTETPVVVASLTATPNRLIKGLPRDVVVTVLDGNGNPVSGVTVTATASSNIGRAPSLDQTSGTTDANGEVTFNVTVPVFSIGGSVEFSGGGQSDTSSARL